MFEIEIRQADGNRTVLIEKPEVIFGRKNEKSEVDVDLNPDTTVSRVHARVWQTEAGIEIEDLGSSVGTVVNGDVLEDATVLRPADVIQMGETVVRVLRKSSSKRRVRTSSAGDELKTQGKGAQSGCRLEFEVLSDGKRTALKVPRGEAFIGRVNDKYPVDVDLSDEPTASRMHARVWVEEGECWVEDLDSRHGVKVNGQSIDGKSKVVKTDKIQIGSAQLLVQMRMEDRRRKSSKIMRDLAETAPKLEVPSDGRYPVWKSDSYCCLPADVRRAGDRKFVEPESARVGVVRVVEELAIDAKVEINTEDQRKSITYFRSLSEFPRELGRREDLIDLCSFIVGRMIKLFPETSRASLFLCDPANCRLRLEAHVPNLKPALSPLLAQQAIANGTGYIWKQCDKEESMQRLPIHGGMYAPIKIDTVETGLICVDTTKEKMDYQREDLSLLVTMAQIAGPYIRLLLGS